MATRLAREEEGKTRLALETAALQLFEADGYDETTVEQIAEVADVSTRTFFRYYPTKADVLLSDQAGRLAMVHDFLAARPSDEPIMASLRALMIAIASDLPAERHLLAAQFRWCRESDDLLAAIRNHHAAIVDLLTEFIGDPARGARTPFGVRSRGDRHRVHRQPGRRGDGLDRPGRRGELPDVDAGHRRHRVGHQRPG